ncbi:MAG: NAD(P)-binding domain-containing protein [Alphaproteobacteria bacterium]|nr:NAD(P)-binding domain-containing protein [Alphaproteobacteria bacterium]
MTLSLRYLGRSEAIAAGAKAPDLAIADVRAVVALMRMGKAGMVPEAVLSMGADPRDKAYALPAFVAGDYDAAGLKWAVHRAGAAGDLPSITNATLVNRLSTGRPVGIVESALLTRMRTAAVSCLAIETLLPGPPRRVAILGAGAQAHTHLEVLSARFASIDSIRIWNRSAETAAALAARAHAGSARVEPAASISAAIEDADVVLTCTNATEPLLDATAVRRGRLIVQVGYHEVAFAAIDASDVVACDLWGTFAATSAKSLFQMHRAGRFPADRIAADLASLVVDGWRPPMGASTYFSSFGLNVFDIALAARVLRRAEASSIGSILPFV